MEDLTEVKKVAETNDEEEVNSALNDGWKIIAVAPGVWSDTKEPFIRYSLGWFGDIPSQKPTI